MISEDKFYDIYRQYEEVITEMNIKLMNFKKKNPQFDISESLETINSIRKLQDYWHRVYHDNVALNSTKGRWFDERFKLASDWAQKEINYKSVIQRLEAENKMLKQDISIKPNI